MPLGQQLKILAVLCVIAALNVFVAGASLGFIDLGRAAYLSAAIALANTVLPCTQLLFGSVAAWRMVRAGADA